MSSTDLESEMETSDEYLSEESSENHTRKVVSTPDVARKTEKSWIFNNFLLIILVFFTLFFIILTIVFAYLYFRLRMDKEVNKKFFDGGSSVDSSYKSILGGMKAYSFSQERSGDILEGVLFLPNDNQEFSYNNQEEDLTYSYFEVDFLTEEQPQEWTCSATCESTTNSYSSEIRRSGTSLLTLPTRTFYLFSVAAAAAVSYYMSSLEDMIDDFCLDDEKDIEDSVKCEMEGKDYFYRCRAVAALNDEAVQKAETLIGMDLQYLYDETEKLYCGDDAKRFGISAETICAKECFQKIINIKNDEFGSRIYKDFIFHGCHKHEGKFSEATGAKVGLDSEEDHHHSLKSCRLCDLDPTLDSDV